jgi:hypothetical protein
MDTDESRDERARIWEALAKHDFAVTNDAALGLPGGTRAHIGHQYFTAATLETDHPTVHKDRDRVRDVIRYEWSGEKLSLGEHDVVEIRNRSGFDGVRTPKRVEVLDDPVMAEWVGTVLSLVPPHLRHEKGTFGINFFRTRTTVVSGPHQDQEEFVVVYVVDKKGEGAETTLHSVGDPDEIVHRVTLAPGDLLIFRDETLLHSVTPLIGTEAQRDALVCTVNYRDTYDLT